MGWWQLTLIVATAMIAAILLDGGQLFVTQAAVQSIVVSTLLPDPDAGLTRWTDALIGGAVALVAATVVPAAPLRRPREQAAVVVRKIAEMLRAASDVMVEWRGRAGDGPARRRPDHRHTSSGSSQSAADEGLSVVASSPFRIRHRGGMRQMSELVDPLDRALRSTRVLVRHTAVSAYHRRPVPRSYACSPRTSPAACDQVAEELSQNRMAVLSRDAVLAVGEATGQVDRAEALSAEAILAQLRSVVTDLLQLAGMDSLEASDSLPRPRS